MKSQSVSPHGESVDTWLKLQHSLAETTGITLITLGDGCEQIGPGENENSICSTMRSSPEHAPLCAADCDGAYEQAASSGQPLEFQCHAGLNCFALPVLDSPQKLVVLGGRAFRSSADYSRFLRTYDDLDAVRNGESLKSANFIGTRELKEARELVSSTIKSHFKPKPAPPVQPPPEQTFEAQVEMVRMSDQLENKSRSIAQLYDFLRGVASTLDSQKVYSSVLAKFSEIMKAGRSSLMILNEESNELAVEAVLGADFTLSNQIRVKLGDGVAGTVLATGTPIVVDDVDTDPRIQSSKRSSYRSKSFISYPIVLGTRKVGVINLTDRADGAPYRSEDLPLLELMTPQLALIIDRTEWHRKAETYQRMSLTDALTGLPNRRYLEERLFEEVERSKRHGTPLSFMIIDVDRFKSYNDIFGHTNADLVLVKTAQIMRRSVRAIDMSARFAGDEFCVVLPETELVDAARIAERLRKGVNHTEYRSEQGELMGKVTISVGVSSLSPSRQSPLVIMETADRALYYAKTHGRNCIAVYEDSIAVD